MYTNRVNWQIIQVNCDTTRIIPVRYNIKTRLMVVQDKDF